MLGGMADDDHNPYAPPAEPVGGDVRAFGDGYEDGPNDFESERRPVILTVLLTLVTLGFYPAIWLIRRRRFLDRQDAGKKLGTALPIFIFLSTMLSLVLAFGFGGQDTAPIRSLCTLVGGVISLIARFRVLHILRSVSSRTGRFLDFSTMATFFLGIHYLQYKINQMADTPARAEGPRRKKKRKKAEARDALEADAEAELRAEEDARRLRTGDPPPAP
jgi:hypothetical protein